MHFPDVNEMIEDITGTGFTLVEYRCLEELHQGVIFSERKRRSKRLLFYAARKI